jgi:ABC-2 type transport system permease protein
MNKLWRVAACEYGRNVFKRSFAAVLFGVPVLLAMSIGMGFVIESVRDNPLPVGYIDHAGVLAGQIPAPPRPSTWVAGRDESIALVAYPSEGEARAALEANAIQAYYVLPADYAVTRRVQLVYVREPGANARQQFFDFLQINLLPAQPDEIARRVAAGSEVLVRSLDGRRVTPAGGPTFGLLMPLFITFAFFLTLMLSAGYMLGAVADEKENRTIEVLLTSVSPAQLMAGKVLGIAAIGLTLAAAWVALTALGIAAAVEAGMAWFGDLAMDWRIVLATAAIAVPAYVLAAALMVAIGALVPTTREAQSISALFLAAHAIPLYVAWTFLGDPQGTLPVVLSLLPFTALMTVGMRSLFTIVPAWQVAAGVAVQAVCALGALWLAGRAFTVGLLSYHQRPAWRGLLGARR